MAAATLAAPPARARSVRSCGGDGALDKLAEWMIDHPDIETGVELLKFFKSGTPWIGKLLWRLK